MTESGVALREAVPRIAGLYRLQWEPAQQGYVLLFPEGMVQLNGSAGEILSRCDGARSMAEIIAELERVFEAQSLGPDVETFLKIASDNGWIEWPKPEAP